ncbi:hypothetical protein [Rosenbergiella australiborealis]|uniref:hypothetical protein n=1 Tax=Rosenbergiella australiborealis TaxID=1544696 RepID=UPI001F4E6CE0|nr:hypothetical protein [Rosenbergiella australiborealis]
MSLSEIVYEELEKDVERICKLYKNIYDYQPNPSTPPNLAWESIPKKIRDILIDLRYRGDYTPRSSEYIQKLAYAGDIEGFGKAISNKSYWENVSNDRFTRRINYYEKIKLISCILILSFKVSAAFTETEINQLNEINSKYKKKEIDSKKHLDLVIKETIANLPKEKNNILKLHKLWEKTTKIKCRLAILESLNTDAEIASKHECLANEYTSEAKFLNSIY